MNKVHGVILVALVCWTVCEIAPVVMIDDLTTAQSIVLITNSGAYPQTRTQQVTSRGVIGGQRDLQLTVSSGSTSKVSSVSISSSSCSISQAAGLNGYTLLQYDGVDSSLTLDPTGLGGVDLTANGGYAFQVSCSTTLVSNMGVRIYDMFAGYSNYSIAISPAGSVPQPVFCPFSAFDGNADFSVVGAVEVIFVVPSNGALTAETLAVVGDVSPTPTKSVTSTRSTSRSRDPSPSSTASRTSSPSQTATRTNTATGTATATPSPVSPSSTPSISETRSSDPSPSQTATKSETRSDKTTWFIPAILGAYRRSAI